MLVEAMCVLRVYVCVRADPATALTVRMVPGEREKEAMDDVGFML